jgi:hypothetical protein
MTCGEHEKKRGNARDCEECWLARQPVHVQVEAAARRLAMVPEPMRVKAMPPEFTPSGRRWCPDCQTFVRERDFPPKRKTRCRACAAAVGREGRLEAQYSISPAEYDLLFQAQDGRCYLCGRRSVRVPLAVDHNHRTGEVRGLLCPDPNYGCNLKILPRFDGDPDPIAMALRLLQYLRDPPARKILSR